MQVVNLLFTLVAIWVVDRGGRRPLLLITSAAMGLSLAASGRRVPIQAVAEWIFGLTLVYVASFAVAMGPVVWVVLAEIFPTRTRGRAMAVATVALWIACFGISQTVPWMFKPPGPRGNVLDLRRDVRRLLRLRRPLHPGNQGQDPGRDRAEMDEVGGRGIAAADLLPTLARNKGKGCVQAGFPPSL